MPYSPQPHHSKTARFQGKNILVVDDEELCRNTLGRLFSSMGAAVETADTGLDALEKIRTGRYDLVLLDVIMRGMDGWDVFASVRKELLQNQLPVLFLTGLVAGEQADYLNQGAEGFAKILDKSCSTASLLDAAWELLDDAGKQL